MDRLGGIYLEHAHHAVVLVLDDVAVEDRLAAEIAQRHREADGLPGTQVHHILPGTVRFGNPVAGEHLEGIDVEVEGVVHVALVDDLPEFQVALLGGDVDAAVVERPTVDEEAGGKVVFAERDPARNLRILFAKNRHADKCPRQGSCT